ncbi:MAG: hydroxyphenylacetyl-CoA thioesterase PaaI [Gammaproteobacteria bacterium]|nr:hydroxyphenylacetyl-CoA thioesterase PaaI [Gammaproteobacteria bacterium]
MSDTEADELASACADAMYERDVAAQAAGIILDSVRCGHASLKMTVRADMLNGHDVCHGGYLFLLADTAFAYACNSYNRVALAQNCDIDFVRPGKEADDLIATAEERRKGGRTGLYDVTVRKSDGEVLAHFRGRSVQLNEAVIQD